MDQTATWPESLPSNRIKAFHELIQSQELTNNLREMLQWPRKIECDPTYEDGLVMQIIAMFKNTLLILGSCTSNQHLEIPTSDMCLSYSSDGQKFENSGKNEGNIIPAKRKKGCHKRRKNSWTSSQVTSALVDDGHAWRKYGQKHINNTNHQRSYYRCTYKFDQGCLAAKQVQKIQDKPPKYKTTYMRNHTCQNLQRAPEIILDSLNSGDTSILFNFETKGLIARTQVGTFFPSIKHELNESYPSHGNLRNDEYSFASDLHCALNACVSNNPLEPNI
ncbi:unnamed protein product [Lactuca virosa]|uniref:WRKY domain-containing protein n=1 Tax=Lactuca virosa TaxID=75947 RepID=A0AAU9P7H2_9ASTR|nr:unnamed protein product [Lactuca virosa]